jgi:capsular exopolysaccharide synthesis family protein
LNDRLAVLRTDMIKAQDAVAQYRATKGLVQLEDRADGLVTITMQELSELNRQLVQVRLRRADVEARLERLHAASRLPGGVETIDEVLASPLIQSLRQHQSEIRRRLAEMSNVYGEKHPQLTNIRAELADIEKNIHGEVNKITEQLEGAAAIVRRQETMLVSQLSDLQQRSLTETKDQNRLSELQRDADVTREIYRNFLARMKETLQQETLQEPDVHVFSAAAEPSRASFPQKAIILPLAFVFSTLGGVVLALLLDLFERGFRDPRQIAQATGTRVLGLIPSYPLKRRSQSFSSFEAAIRDLLTALMLSGEKDAKSCLVITSSVPMEGKTTLAVAIARQIAQSGRTCALVDGDLRRSRLHEALGVSSTPGLGELCAETVEVSAVIRSDSASGLSYVTAGTLNGQSVELLESAAMRRLLAELRRTHDFVIIDTPPVMIVSDALLLAKTADEVLYVVEWGKTKRETAIEGLDRVRSASGRAALVVVNQVDERRYASYGLPDSARYSTKYSEYYRRSQRVQLLPNHA